MSYLTAQRLLDINDYDIKCRYLEGSRFAWRMAEYHLLTDAEILDKICVGGVHVTLRKIMSRGGLSPEEIDICATDLGLKGLLDNKLNYSETVAYKNVLITDARLFEYIRSHSKKAYDVAHDYFEQEGLLARDKVSIVDSGWVGTMQQTLANIVGRKVEGYYFGLYELPRGVKEEEYHTFFFAPYKDIGKKVFFSNCLFESIFSAGEGMTCGYEALDGSIIPVRETDGNPNEERVMNNVSILQELLQDTEYIDSIIKNEPEVYVKRMQRIMSYPTKDEAECIGSYLFSDDVNRDSIQELAAPLTIEEIGNTHALRRALIMKGYYSRTLNESAWLEGSIARCDKSVKYNFLHCRLYKVLIYLRKMLKQ